MNFEIGLMGLPNAGKTSLFNALTGGHQKVANFPGITVERKIGFVKFGEDQFQVSDLPGVYTLEANTLDEKVSRDFVFRKGHFETENEQMLVVVMDATNLRKSIYLALQIKELGRNFVVALNMYDEATKRGLELDLKKLETYIGAPIIPTVAVDSTGKDDLLKKIKENYRVGNLNVPVDYQIQIKKPDYIKDKMTMVTKILSDVTVSPIRPDSFTEKLDSILLHPFWGVVVLLAILMFMFQMLFAWSDPFMALIEGGFDWLSGLIMTSLPDIWPRSFLVDGVIAGVGGVLVFLPHICFLFMMILFLEDVGYLGRAAFLLDYLMRKFGLPGKAVVPLLSSHACAIPGIMSSRIIDNPVQRLMTMMISPLMTCSARLPVYTLLIAAIVPNTTVMGFLGLPGLVMFGFYLMGILSGFMVAIIGQKTLRNQSASVLMMELPSYRIPRLKNILLGTWSKAKIFLKKAGTIILVLSMLIWVMVTFPKAPEGATGPAINYSAAAIIGKTIEPVFRPMGFDWRITTALIPSFGAREVLVSAMGTVMAVEGNEDDDSFFENLRSQMVRSFGVPSLIALLVWFVFSPQCIATFGVLRRETGGFKYPTIFGLYTLALAYFCSFAAFQVFSLLMG